MSETKKVAFFCEEGKIYCDGSQRQRDNCAMVCPHQPPQPVTLAEARRVTLKQLEEAEERRRQQAIKEMQRHYDMEQDDEAIDAVLRLLGGDKHEHIYWSRSEQGWRACFQIEPGSYDLHPPYATFGPHQNKLMVLLEILEQHMSEQARDFQMAKEDVELQVEAHESACDDLKELDGERCRLIEDKHALQTELDEMKKLLKDDRQFQEMRNYARSLERKIERLKGEIKERFKDKGQLGEAVGTSVLLSVEVDNLKRQLAESTQKEVEATSACRVFEADAIRGNRRAAEYKDKCAGLEEENATLKAEMAEKNEEVLYARQLAAEAGDAIKDLKAKVERVTDWTLKPRGEARSNFAYGDGYRAAIQEAAALLDGAPSTLEALAREKAEAEKLEPILMEDETGTPAWVTPPSKDWLIERLKADYRAATAQARRLESEAGMLRKALNDSEAKRADLYDATQKEKAALELKLEEARDEMDRWKFEADLLTKIVEQAIQDLNQAHDYLMVEGRKRPGKGPEISLEEARGYDWPEWTPQANTIRWAERTLKKRLAKTTAWTEWPGGHEPPVNAHFSSTKPYPEPHPCNDNRLRQRGLQTKASCTSQFLSEPIEGGDHGQESEATEQQAADEEGACTKVLHGARGEEDA